jgi:hypothetical protein
LSNINNGDDVPPRTTAPLPRPPAMSSGGRRTLRVLVVVIAASLSLSTLGGLAAFAYWLGHMRVYTDSQALPPGMRSLSIDTGDDPGTLRIITDINATEPRIDSRTVTSADDTPPTVAHDGVDVRVTLRDRGPGLLRFNRTGEIRIILPPDVGSGLKVTVEQRAGSLSADADLDQLVVETEAGSVTLAGSARRVDISARNGDIETSTRIAVAESFRAESESGRITLEFRSAPRLTEAKAEDDVAVGVPGPGPYRVRAESEHRRGKTVVSVPETTDPSAPEVIAHSKRGNAIVHEMR